jgi:hypothetical protein
VRKKILSILEKAKLFSLQNRLQKILNFFKNKLRELNGPSELERAEYNKN